MATELRSFKRLVIGLQPSSPGRATRLAVQIANMMRLDLLGVILDDTNLHGLARIPIAREFQLLGGGWRSIDFDQLSNDLEAAARKNERLFAEAVKGLSASCRFEMIKGQTATTMKQVARSDDIVMVVEPASAGERVTQQFSWLIDAASGSASAVMFVPPMIARSAGPVAVIAAAPGTRAISASATIAAATNEDLVIVEAPGIAIDETSLREISQNTGVAIKRVIGAQPFSDPESASRALHDLRERLIVVPRSAMGPENAMLIGSSRRVPVLMID